MKNQIVSIALFLGITQITLAQNFNIGELTNNGAWCWFSDPRAIFDNNSRSIITGWVKNDGTIEVASLNIENGEVTTHILYDQLEYDDHDNPAFAVLPDGKILAMYALHSTAKGVIFNITEKASDITTFSSPEVFKPKTEKLLKDFPRETYTYANPYVLSKENSKLYAFGRWIGFKPNMIVSDDSGKSWHSPKVIISPEKFDPGNRPYVKYFSDGKSRVHMIYTDGHPRNEPQNSVFYCYYEKGAFWKADNSLICKIEDLPFETKDASLVYKPSGQSGLSWISDLAVDSKRQPVLLYSRYPKETDHRYHYAWFNKSTSKWVDHEICKAGKWFPQTREGQVEKEPHYLGNMTLHPTKPNTIYISRQIDGIFEIEKRVTADGGKTWKIEAITSNSKFDNVRPYVPRGTGKKDKTVVLWMQNKKYIHYTNYDVAIKYIVD